MIEPLAGGDFGAGPDHTDNGVHLFFVKGSHCFQEGRGFVEIKNLTGFKAEFFTNGQRMVI